MKKWEIYYVLTILAAGATAAFISPWFSPPIALIGIFLSARQSMYDDGIWKKG